MAARSGALLLRERIGNDATDTLLTMMDESSRARGEEVMKTMVDRFERRLSEEISALRIEMHKGFADIRSEFHGELGQLRAEMHAGFASVRVDSVRWAFLFWIGQLGAMAGLLTYLK
jgi:hypothetical protein